MLTLFLENVWGLVALSLVPLVYVIAFSDRVSRRVATAVEALAAAVKSVLHRWLL